MNDFVLSLWIFHSVLFALIITCFIFRMKNNIVDIDGVSVGVFMKIYLPCLFFVALILLGCLFILDGRFNKPEASVPDISISESPYKLECLDGFVYVQEIIEGKINKIGVPLLPFNDSSYMFIGCGSRGNILLIKKNIEIKNKKEK